MADMLALLNEELKQNVAKRDGLRKQHSGDTMPPDASAEFNSLTERANTIVAEIEKEKQKRADQAFDQQKAYLDNPQIAVIHSVNADEPGRKVLSSIGWESKAGVLYAPTSVGKMQAMYNEEVLFGPIPDDDLDAAKYFKQTRAILQPVYRETWLKWIRSPYHASGGALAMLSATEQKALSEGSDASGGFVVPPDIQAELMVRRAQTSVMRRLATVRSTSRDKWVSPALSPNAVAADRNIYSDGFVGTWVGETPSQNDTDPGFESFEISIKKIRVKTTLSNDWLSDAVGNMIAQLSQSGGRNLGLVEDKGFVSGDGGPLQPQGILSHPLALTLVASAGMAYDVEGVTANTISNSTTDAGSAPKIKQLVYQLASQYAENAVWLARRTIQGKIAGLVDANGRPFWNSYLESGFGRPSLNIEGYPVIGTEFVGADGVVSVSPATIPLIFGDISAYHIIDRAQISVRVLTERYADNDQTGLIMFERVGGGLWNYDAIRTGVIAS